MVIILLSLFALTVCSAVNASHDRTGVVVAIN
jgi:hypothetical protein